MADFKLEAAKVTVISIVDRDWPDGCLGLGGTGMMCTQAIVPGFEVVLEADGKTYTYRTDARGRGAIRDPRK